MVEEQNEQIWGPIVDDAVERHFEEMVAMRRHLHQQPEPSGEEVETTQYLKASLESLPVRSRTAPSGRGLIVDSGNRAARIGIRADIDALRIQDQKTCPYRSQVDGVMHACGHDAHTATVYGAMLALIDFNEKHPDVIVPWRVIFQPAEETNKGAVEMVDAGAVDGLQALFGVHMDPSRSVETVGVRSGAFTADCHELEIEVLGVGAHAARPHEACDPIAATSQLISSIFLFVPRSTDSQDPVVISFGQIIAGENPNVIPDRVVVRGTLRTLDERISLATIQHLERLARGVAEASGTKIFVRHQHGPPSVYNDPELNNILLDSAIKLLGETNVENIPRPSMGGEDFANYLKSVRGAMFRLGCALPDLKAPPLHSPLFDIDERSLAVGAKILARSVVAWSQRQIQN